MAEPFLSEIRIFSFNYAPKGWALCNGQFLPINQNQALFALLGTTYGGNGQTTFALPDLRGRVPIHFGDGFTLGQAGGKEFHTLTQSEMPAHNHFAQAATNQTNAAIPGGQWLGQALNQYNANVASLTTLTPQTIGSFGGSQPHENREPSLVLNFCIALQGIFPSRN
jgi:microcystin-dependent protein